MKAIRFRILLAMTAMTVLLLWPLPAAAHCDTMDGPVVRAAQLALRTADVTPVLKWVSKSDESQIRALFERTLKVRALSPEARELADYYFFETLVRVHRAGEGEPYTGLKPAGTEVEPGIALADSAVDSGSVDQLIKQVTQDVAVGIRERFTHVREASKHADDSVEAGRQYVAAYVDFIHYVENIHEVLRGAASHGNTGAHIADAGLQPKM